LHLGFGSFGEYVERLFGYGRRSTEERLRVAEALEHLPELEHALRDGTMSWSLVRELTRVATPDNEQSWLEVARGRTVRQIEELVAGHGPGDRPEDPCDGSLKRRVLRFEVSAETYATMGEALAKLRHEASGRLDDDAALLLLARQALGGPAESGRGSYQIALTVCQACGRGWQQGRGELVEVGPEVIEMAGCDGQHIGRIDGGRERVDSLAVPDGSECDDDESAEPACAEGVRSRVAVGEPTPAAHVGARATQSVPPAVRRRVLRRDRGRCVVPGCTQSVFVDIHHILLRSEGGGHDPDMLVVLCCAHHRALHRGQLIIEGSVSTGLVFRHADGGTYGQTVRPSEVALYEEVFRALRSLGFRESEARRMLERVRDGAHVRDRTVPSILRKALSLLRPSQVGGVISHTRTKEAAVEHA
jgi:hypothetical protein